MQTRMSSTPEPGVSHLADPGICKQVWFYAHAVPLQSVGVVKFKRNYILDLIFKYIFAKITSNCTNFSVSPTYRKWNVNPVIKYKNMSWLLFWRVEVRERQRELWEIKMAVKSNVLLTEIECKWCLLCVDIKRLL